jgi:hypothetical protein
MIRKIVALVLIAVMLFLMAGCAAHIHKVGKGGGGSAVEERQWYILWGLVPINEVDTAEMADGAEDYTITTEYGPLDVLISIVAGIVTINSRTVTVEK